MTDQAKVRFKELQSSELKTGRAWALKEVSRELWNHTSAAWTLKFWKHWYYWVTHSRLQPMTDPAKLMARHLPNVLTYFEHRITNAVAEGLNSKIATVQNEPVDSGTVTISRSPSISTVEVLIGIRLRLPMDKSDEPSFATPQVRCHDSSVVSSTLHGTTNEQRVIAIPLRPDFIQYGDNHA